MGKRSRKVRESRTRKTKAEAASPPPPVNKNKLLISILLIIALSLAVYANSLSGKFLWDDDLLVKDNAYIRNWANVSNIFSKDIGAGAMVKFPSYRPVQILTYVIDYSIWKLNPLGYHLTNVLFHTLAALCVFWLMNILFRDLPVSLLASVLFAIHPVHTEAVSYISGRADPIALVFVLLTLIFYIRANEKKEILPYLFMALCYAIALWARENSMIVIALIFLYHCTFVKKFAIARLLPILAISAFYILLRLTTLRSILFYKACGDPLYERLPGLFAALTGYVRLLFLPLDLHMEYGYKRFYFDNPAVLSGIVILSLLLIYAYKNRESSRLIFFSVGWFLVGLLPVSNLYPINAYMSEHWLYLPSIGFFLLLSKLLCDLCRNKGLKLFGILLISGAVFYYSILTIIQNNYWSDPAAFYEYTLKYLGRNYRILNNLAKLYEEAGKHQEAVALYERAIAAEPGSADVYYNLGNTYNNMNNKELAIASYKKAIALNPRHFRAYNNLAVMDYNTGKTEDAIAAFKKVIELEPNFPFIRKNLGVLYYNSGKYQDAAEWFKKALESDPNNADAAKGLAAANQAIKNKK